MIVRVKVVCNFKTHLQHVNGQDWLQFSQVYSGSEENQKFFAATPGGSFTFYTVNREAAGQFEIGKEYYFDIHAVENPVPQFRTETKLSTGG